MRRKYPYLALLLALILILTPITNAFAVINDLTIKYNYGNAEYSSDLMNPTIFGSEPYHVEGDVYSDVPMDTVNVAIYSLAGTEPLRQSQGYTYKYLETEPYRWNASLYGMTPLGLGDYRMDVLARNQNGDTVTKSAYFKIKGIEGLQLIIANSQGVIASSATSNDTALAVADVAYDSYVTAYVYAFSDAAATVFHSNYSGQVEIERINLDGYINPLTTAYLYNGVGSYTFKAGTEMLAGDKLVVKSGDIKVKTQINIDGSNGIPGGNTGGGGTGTGNTGGSEGSSPGNYSGELPGKLTNWKGNPISYVSVSFYKADQDKWMGNFGNADEQGNFTVYGLNPGNYNVALNHNGKWLELGTATLELASNKLAVTGSTGNVGVDQDGKLKLSLPEPKVKGKLTKGGVPLAKAWVNVRQEGYDSGKTSTSANGTGEFYNTMTDSQGYFGFNLPDGNYLISDISYPDASASENVYHYTQVMLNKPFNVPNDTTGLMEIAVPEPNVSGVVSGVPAPEAPQGQPGSTQMENVSLSFVSVNIDEAGNEVFGQYFWTPAKWDVSSQEYKFGLFLPAGKYKVGANVKGKWVELPGEYIEVAGAADDWTVAAGTTNKTVAVNANKVSVTIPTANVTGSLRDASGNPVANAWLTIRAKNAGEFDWAAYKWTSTDSAGNFSLYLPDGAYIVTEVWQTDGISTKLSREFSVANGLLNGQDAQNLDVIIKGPNVVGAVRQADDQPLNAKVWVGIRKAETTQYEGKNERWVETQPDGSFSLSLQPGSYEVYGISTSNEWLELQNQSFTIDTAGNLVDNGTLVTGGNLVLKLPGKNVRGVLTRGNVPLTYAWITIRDRNATGTKGSTAGANSSTAGASDLKWAQTDAEGKFGIQLAAGSYLIDGISNGMEWIPWQQEFNVNDTTSPVNLQVAIPGKNLNGQALDENGLPIANAWITLAPVSALTTDGRVADYLKARWLETDAQGQFAGTLPPDTYRVTGISTSTRWVELSGPQFTISSTGVAKITVQIPSANVKGIVLGDDGKTPLANAWIEIRPEEATANDYTASKWISTDANGKFSLILEDNGSSKNYKIAGISYSTQSNYKWVEMHQSFKVTKGQVTGLTVKIPGMNFKGTVYANELKTQRVANAWIAVAPVESASGEWSTTKWTGTDSNGEFAMNLIPGTYRVTGISTDKGWKEIAGVEFTITEEESSNLDVIIPAPNTTGTAYNEAGQALANVWLEIRPANAAETDWNKFKWIQTDSQGRFELILEPGSYLVKGIGTVDGWVQLNQAFTGPQLNLEVRIPAPNVIGTVDGAGIGKEAWVAVKPASAPADDWSKTIWAMTKDGQFSFVLERGVTYQFVGISNEKGWTELGDIFSVPDQGAYNAGIIGQASLKLSGVVTINGNPAANVTVGIRPEGKKTRWVQTDANGYYETAVTAGNYTITYVVNDSTWIGVNQAVTVQSQSVTQDIGVTNP